MRHVKGSVRRGGYHVLRLRPGGWRSGSQPTRQRLLGAAAELIAEVGWGRVTGRAVASRAELPHGTVSYHFRGKQELLIEAALHSFELAVPVSELETLRSLTDFVATLEAWLGDPDAIDPVLAGVGIEAMLESERDPALRDRLAQKMRDYRRILTEIARINRPGRAARRGVTPAGLATLLAAVGDGLVLHGRLDPELNSGGALATLRALLRS